MSDVFQTFNHRMSETQLGLMKPFIEDGSGYGLDAAQASKLGLLGKKCVTLNVGYRQKVDDKGNYYPVAIKKIMTAERAIQLGFRHQNLAQNAYAFPKESMIQLDTAILRESRFRLGALEDLRASNVYGGFNGMSKTMLEYQMIDDSGEAIVDMDGRTPGRNDDPLYALQGMPLAITHSDFEIGARQQAMSKNTPGEALDTTKGEMAGRRIAESLERQVIGVETGIKAGGTGLLTGGYAYGTSAQVFGYLTFPGRLTKTNLYKPTGVGRAGTGWVPNDTILDVLAMKDSLVLNKFFGPWMIYHSNDWDQYLDRDYNIFTAGGSVAGGTITLRERLKKIPNVQDVKRLDLLTASALALPTTPGSSSSTTDLAGPTSANPFTLVMVQMNAQTARLVVGLDVTTVQWEEMGGMVLKFKVMTIQAPQIRATYAGNCGLLHANGSAGV
jgi:hypothetical protein